MASAISSTGILSVDSMQGKSLSAITTNFLNQSLNSNEKDKLRRIVANTQRAISLVEGLWRCLNKEILEEYTNAEIKDPEVLKQTLKIFPNGLD